MNEKESILNISYIVEEPKTYLVVQLKEGVIPIEYCLRVAEQNDIAALFTMHHQVIDGCFNIYYDITGKKRLSDWLREEKNNYNTLFPMLNNLIRGFMDLSNYFLRPNQCVLLADHVFIDNKGQAQFALVPLESDAEESGTQLQSFFAEILGLGATTDNKDYWYAPLLTYLFRPTFQLEEFASILAEMSRNSDGNGMRETSKNKVIVPKPLEPTPLKPQAISDMISADNTKVDEQSYIPQPPKEPEVICETDDKNAIKIPGGGSVNMPAPSKEKDKKKKREKNKPEKTTETKKHSRFSLPFGKKKAEVSLDEEAHIISASSNIPPAQSVKPSGTPVAEPFSVNAAEWNGTVNLQVENFGKTEVLISHSSAMPALLYNGKRIEITTIPFTLGRLDCNLLLDNPKVSRKHATILYDNGQYMICDENSANHTFLDNVMIPPFTPVALTNGAEIRLGDERLQIDLGNVNV